MNEQAARLERTNEQTNKRYSAPVSSGVDGADFLARFPCSSHPASLGLVPDPGLGNAHYIMRVSKVGGFGRHAPDPPSFSPA